MEHYEFIQKLGEGMYGTVYKAVDKRSGALVAVKRFKMAHEDVQMLQLAQREAQLLKAASHPNVVQLHSPLQRASNGHMYLVTEFVVHTLLDHLRGALGHNRRHGQAQVQHHHQQQQEQEEEQDQGQQEQGQQVEKEQGQEQEQAQAQAQICLSPCSEGSAGVAAGSDNTGLGQPSFVAARCGGSGLAQAAGGGAWCEATTGCAQPCTMHAHAGAMQQGGQSAGACRCGGSCCHPSGPVPGAQNYQGLTRSITKSAAPGCCTSRQRKGVPSSCQGQLDGSMAGPKADREPASHGEGAVPTGKGQGHAQNPFAPQQRQAPKPSSSPLMQSLEHQQSAQMRQQQQQRQPQAQPQQGLPELSAKLILWQILQATAYMHLARIIHRDLTPSNVLVSASGIVKLCDFGFARTVAPGSGPGIGKYTQYITTRWYRAPEVLVGAPYGTPADVWAIGCLFYEMLTGQPLVPGRDAVNQLALVVQAVGPLPASQLALLSGSASLPVLASQASSLKARCAEQGIDAAASQVLRSCLHPDPDRRLTARHLLSLPYFDDIHQYTRGTELQQVYDKAYAAALYRGSAAAPCLWACSSQCLEARAFNASIAAEAAEAAAGEAAGETGLLQSEADELPAGAPATQAAADALTTLTAQGVACWYSAPATRTDAAEVAGAGASVNSDDAPDRGAGAVAAAGDNGRHTGQADAGLQEHRRPSVATAQSDEACRLGAPQGDGAVPAQPPELHPRAIIPHRASRAKLTLDQPNSKPFPHAPDGSSCPSDGSPCPVGGPPSPFKLGLETTPPTVDPAVAAAAPGHTLVPCSQADAAHAPTPMAEVLAPLAISPVPTFTTITVAAAEPAVMLSAADAPAPVGAPGSAPSEDTAAAVGRQGVEPGAGLQCPTTSPQALLPRPQASACSSDSSELPRVATTAGISPSPISRDSSTHSYRSARETMGSLGFGGLSIALRPAARLAAAAAAANLAASAAGGSAVSAGPELGPSGGSFRYAKRAPGCDDLDSLQGSAPQPIRPTKVGRVHAYALASSMPCIGNPLVLGASPHSASRLSLLSAGDGGSPRAARQHDSGEGGSGGFGTGGGPDALPQDSFNSARADVYGSFSGSAGNSFRGNSRSNLLANCRGRGSSTALNGGSVGDTLLGGSTSYGDLDALGQGRSGSFARTGSEGIGSGSSGRRLGERTRQGFGSSSGRFPSTNINRR